eukprot:10526132-Karenia_brevis.AAC.1
MDLASWVARYTVVRKRLFESRTDLCTHVSEMQDQDSAKRRMERRNKNMPNRPKLTRLGRMYLEELSYG